MIILDDRGWTMQQMILKNKEQIQGSQTWLDDIPGGLHTRCHYYDGRFSVENYMEIGISPIGLAKSHAEKIFEERINLEELWNANVQGKYFSEEEWNCLLKDGFLGVLRMRCPELEDSKAFNFCLQVDQKIKELEQKYREKPHSEIIKEIESHAINENADNRILWEFLKKIYTRDLVLGENSEQRKKYMKFLDISRQQEIDSERQDEFVEDMELIETPENKFKQYSSWVEGIRQKCNDKNFMVTETLQVVDYDVYSHYELDNDLHVYISNPQEGESKVWVFDGPSLQRYKEAGKFQRSMLLDEYTEGNFYNMQLEFTVGDVKSSDDVPGFIDYQDDMQDAVAFLPDKAGRYGGTSGPEIYIDINSDLSEDIGEKLEKAINSTNDPELQSTYRKALEFYTKIQEVVKTQNKHKEIDSKKTSKTRTDSQKIDDDLSQWLGGEAPEVEGTAEGYSINEYGEIEKKDPDIEELESLRDKKQQLLGKQEEIAKTEKLVEAMEKQGPKLDE